MAEPIAIRRVAIGADHGGFELKEAVKAHLRKGGLAVEDCGTHGTQSVDYPVFAQAVARLVADGRADRGIVVDRAGIGSAMAANKVPGVRAALCYDLSSARNSREHNNANVLTLGSGLVGPDLALQIVDVWLATECTEERHLRRAAMIEGGGERSDGATKRRGDGGGEEGGRSVAEAMIRGDGGAVRGQENVMETLTESDIERIVGRITELMGSATSGLAGGACSNPACAFCASCMETNPEFVRQLVGVGADRVAHRPGGCTLPSELAGYIDHTLLKPDASRDEVVNLCEEARRHGFASVCVNPTYVRMCADRLGGSRVKVCSVVGFPLGAHVPEIKALETRRAIRDGAREIDMVINVGALKSGDDELVYRDIRAVTESCIDGGAICKVIIEAALLADDEKVRACQAARRARADFVKTSTGFGPGGATAHDVALMAETVREAHMGVKAAGGIRSYEDAEKMIRAGATRLGASAGVRILKEASGLSESADRDAPRHAKVGSYE